MQNGTEADFNPTPFLSPFLLYHPDFPPFSAFLQEHHLHSGAGLTAHQARGFPRC